MTSQSYGHKERLRTRFEKSGLDGFLDYEILEMLLSFVVIRKDTKIIAKKLLENFGNVTAVLDASPEELMKIDGLGKRSVVLFQFFKELMTYYTKEQVFAEKQKVLSPDDVYDYFVLYYGGKKYEEFCVMFLNTAGNVINVKSYGEGTINYAYIYPRNILHDALKLHAASIILIHNHPAATKEPSKADIAFTEKLQTVSSEIGIQVLDHILIAGKEAISFKSMGYL